MCRHFQVLQRIDDVSLMCEKRVACLKKLALKPKRPVQQVIPEPGVPLQPPGGAPHPLRLRKSQHRQVSEHFHIAFILGPLGMLNVQMIRFRVCAFRFKKRPKFLP